MPPVSKAQQRQAHAAAEAFDAYFAREYGEERWARLRARLVLPTEYAALINAYAPSAEVDRALLAEASMGSYALLRLPSLPDRTRSEVPTRLLCLTRATLAPGERPFPPPHPAAAEDEQHRVHTHWNLDAASVLAAHCLDVKPGHAVLDLCAAPGGKSLTLAQQLWPERYADRATRSTGTPSLLHANEADAPRHRRLHANLQAYLPPALFDEGLVETLRIDGTSPRAVHLFPLGEKGYDRVLLDAPCSSERHILHAHVRSQKSGTVATEMLAWKPTLTRSLAKTQLALLRTAWQALREGGKLVYATCSLSRHENDQVIGAFLRSLEGPAPRFLETHALAAFCEKTQYGYLALPDHTAPQATAPSPWGPLYFSVLTKPT